MAAKIWKRILCSKTELKLDRTLACGQSFRWRVFQEDEWIGVLAGKVFVLRQDDQHIYYKTYSKISDPVYDNCNVDVEPKTKNIDSGDKIEDADILRDYFQLNINLEELYQFWSNRDLNFKSVSSKFSGIRILRQDPVENLFSFICSSNNHISRISQMVEKLCSNYGEEIAEVNGVPYFSFPSVKSLSGKGVEAELRVLGFGYRAKYISQSAKYIMENHDDDWLKNLRGVPYKEAKAALMKLCGVGAKVADCVCLMSLDKTGAVPVDTHVWQIAARDYIPKLKQSKSLTEKLYEEIGDHFREIWGPYAGWAHSVLFTADLKQFKEKSETKTEKLKRKKKETLKSVSKSQKR